MVPSISRCFEFMEIYEMPLHIRAHSIMVEKVASILAVALQEQGAILSLEKVRAGALMHDIAKSICFESGEDHSAKGREICLRYGLEEIAEIVGEHVRMRNLLLDGPVTEKEIVYYADKRVNHDTVVSLEQRLEYLIERYGKGLEPLSQVIADNFKICRDVERKIFSTLRFGPGDLSEMVGKK